MKRNIPIFITILSIIIAAASMSFAIKANQQRRLAENEADALRKSAAEMPTQTSRSRTASTEPARISDEFAGTTNQLTVLQESTPEPQQKRPDRESFEERMAKMKEEDPEAYAEMIQQRGERQQTIRYNLAERTATFMDLDTASMTEEERVNHELLVEKMANVWALTEQFQDPEAAPNRESMKELFSEMREVRPLLDQERTVMFKQLGSDLGYEGEETENFATHVQDIINATTLQIPRGGSPGGGRGGRGGQ